MKTATKLRDLPVTPVGAAQILWGLSEPHAGTEFVITSAVSVPYSGPETYIFPANEAGEVTDWGELDGSFRGGLDHECAIRLAGYEIVGLA